MPVKPAAHAQERIFQSFEFVIVAARLFRGACIVDITDNGEGADCGRWHDQGSPGILLASRELSTNPE
jgi:hypothetical protein